MSAKARELILAPKNTIWVSAVTIWEISIKHSLGRGDMPVSGKLALEYFRQARYRLLPVEPEHAAAIEGLPAHHQDPFDRLLVAQALTETMRRVTHDGLVARFSDGFLCIRVERQRRWWRPPPRLS
ncbi:MAG TPA: type II toxin-antitoxin system VapC family toxin [Accumulibacter sp.]|uniref:type II toxin-antitoxin system VapC family toxin n=1 Tax=unclassified Candidatus Accumulibacter TaxID=2619054 RepID=UPI0025C4E58F|nr:MULTISPECIES: type II toxin-antitoxin system VapC family toxin [unclassified Candidatus Accumulibacter]HRE72561.1 type II toxin-antitoxin system VapC family toxin [Accumulibacter sp.]